MTTLLQREIDRWQAQLDEIAETSTFDDWYLEERRLAEAQHTIIAYRGRILPLLTDPGDRVVALEIEHLVDRLEDLRNDLFGADPVSSYEEITETLVELRGMSQVALNRERMLQDVS